MREPDTYDADMKYLVVNAERNIDTIYAYCLMVIDKQLIFKNKENSITHCIADGRWRSVSLTPLKKLMPEVNQGNGEL